MDLFVRLSESERAEYFIETARRMRLSPQIIEKDFWVCWILKTLFTQSDFKESLIFKGGTSLSKVFDVIKRFSEDIDVSISRDSLGFGGEADPESASGSKERKRRIGNLKVACQSMIKKELMPQLNKDISAKIDKNRWRLELDNNDPDGQTILFFYPASVTKSVGDYIRPAVKIELGARSDHWPSEIRNISSYVATEFPSAFKDTGFIVKVLSVERTFWEKATLLHAEYHRPTDKIMPSRLSRHYYDFYQLIVSGISAKAVNDLALLKRVVEHKKVFFQSYWAKYDEAKKGSLHISPPEDRIKMLMEDYARMQDMFFDNPPELNEIIKILIEWESDFNRSA